MMTVIDFKEYRISAFWERRAETPDALAARFVQMIDRLQEIDPFFALWTCVAYRRRRFETMRDRYAEVVAEGLAKSDWGEPVPICGYSFSALTRGQARNRLFSLWIHAGSTLPKPFPNDILFMTSHGFIPDPADVTYEIFKPALRAMVEAWDPVCAKSYPDTLFKLVPGNIYFHETWIQYLCPGLLRS